MGKFKNISGRKFGRLTALYRLHNYHDKKNSYWLCICDCGNLKESRLPDLKSGNTKSCGCLNSEISKYRMTKHGKHNTRLYHIYCGMKNRCQNCNDPKYPNYGGRGIKVCDEWLNDFMAFYNWAIDNGYKDDLTIDRINVDGNYKPDNCRWATPKQQSNNKRNTIYINYNGESKTLSEWCEVLNLNYYTVYDRLYRYNWSIENALEL